MDRVTQFAAVKAALIGERKCQGEGPTDWDALARAAIAAIEDGWEPHRDYAGEPMQPGEFRDPPPPEGGL